MSKMSKLRITPQAKTIQWYEEPLGTFHLKIVSANSEAASNCRKYLPLIEKFLLLGWNGDSEKVMETKNELIKGE